VPIGDYAKERNRASIRSAVERSGYSQEKLETILAAIDKRAAEREAGKPNDDNRVAGEPPPPNKK
jgi:hypothetical protein